MGLVKRGEKLNTPSISFIAQISTDSYPMEAGICIGVDKIQRAWKNVFAFLSTIINHVSTDSHPKNSGIFVNPHNTASRYTYLSP